MDSRQLDAEELDFLRELLAETADDAAPAVGDRRLVLDPGSSDAVALMELLGSDRLELSATRGQLLYRFALRVERPPAGFPLTLCLEEPRIVELGARPRAARVRPAAHEVQVRDNDGKLRASGVHDLSATGIALRANPERMPRGGRRVDLQLRLAGSGPLDLHGRVVRVSRGGADTDERMLGIEFEDTDPTTRDVLERYVLKRQRPLS